MLRRIVCAVVIVMAGVSCSRDPEVVKKKYLQNGNRYFEKHKYKEAYIMYRNALKKDPKYSEAYYKAGLAELQMGRRVDALRDFRRAIDTDPNFTNPDARVQAGNILLFAYLSSPSPRPASLQDELKGVAGQLIKKQPDSAPALRLDGYVKLLVDNDTPGAIAQLRRANQISPLSPEYALPLVEALLLGKQNAEAEELARNLIAKHKNFLPVYDRLFDAYRRENRVADAEAVLKLKAANNPKDSVSLLQLAQFYYFTQRPADMKAALDKLSSNRADFPEGRRRAGRFYAIIRNFDAAIDQFQAAMREDPSKQDEYRKEIAQVLMAQKKNDEASRTLDDILKGNPKDDQARAMRAALLIETGGRKQVEQAVADLQSVVGQHPHNPVLRFNLGRALLAQGQADQARVQLQEAIRIHPGYVAARLALANVYLLQQQYGNARQEADAALKTEPRNLQAKLVRTSALAAMGNGSEARAELVQAIKDYPNSSEAGLQLAALDLRERRPKEAEEAFAKLYKANPSDLRALLGLSETYVIQNQYGKAIDVLKAELAKNPSRLELRNALGNVAYRAGNYPLAVEQFQALIRARPESADAYIRLGQTYLTKGDTPQALQAFEKAKQLKPADPQPYLQLAILYEKSGQQAKARPIYEQVLKLQPDHPVALNNLAYMMAETGGDLDQALALAQRARDRMPDNPDVADTLGWIYIKKHLSDNAVTLFRDLVAKQPQVSTYRYHLAMALYQRGDKPETKKALEGALERKPSPEETAKIKELMERVR